AKGLISEQRVIASVLHRQAGKFGGARIRQALQALGLESEAIGLAIGSLQGSEAERAQAVWQKKFGAPPADAQAAAKQMRFLLARGFGADIARRIVAGPYLASQE
ncbi:MAG: regulatory protein RecX, partial [Betaproteobacteria bacterium]|nr:regulatory protein RecX [Betaproteobacteria bacterium]NDE73981.1 regulatory protein RecX [Betaproteobacteria bacterium]